MEVGGHRRIRMNAVEIQMGIGAANTPRCILRRSRRGGRTLWLGPAAAARWEGNHAVSKIVTIGEILVEIMATRPGQSFLEPGLLVGPYPERRAGDLHRPGGAAGSALRR